MAKFCDNTVYDGAFGVLDNASRVTVTVTQPANFAGISGATILATTSMTPTTDYTKAVGDAGTGSRKCTMAAKSGVSISATGTANFVNLDDGTTLLYTTTCTAQSLTSGGTVNIPTWKVEFGIPS